MKSEKMVIGVVMMLTVSWGGWTWAAVECSTMAAIVSACSRFISYGTPQPVPGTPCCDAMNSLHVIADSVANKRSVCGCLTGLITTYYPHATAIATLPGLCGVDLGFTIDPNTDCNYFRFQAPVKSNMTMQGPRINGNGQGN